MSGESKNSKYKLQLNIVLSLIIVSMLGIGIYTNKLIDKTKEQNQAHIKEVTIQVANSITTKFDVYFKELNYIKRSIIENDVLSDETKQILLKYKIDEKVFDEILVLDNQGAGVTSQQKPIDIGGTPYFESIKKSNDICVSDPKTTELIGEDLVLYSIPVKKENENTGFIVGINKAQILMSKLSTGVYGNEGNSYIVNKDGNIIFSNEKKYIGKDIFKLLYKDDTDDTLAKHKESFKNEKQGSIEESVDSNDLYIGFSIIPYTNEWYVIKSIQEKSILKNTENTTHILVVIIAFIIFTFIIIGIYFFIVQERLKKAAFKDKITDINNYEKFLLDAKDFIKNRRKNKRILLLCFDIDKFKIINDIHGYETGDKVLKAIAQNIKTSFDSKAVYGRITGDIFALIVETEANDKEINMVVEIIRKDVINLSGHDELDYAFNLQTCVGVYIVQDTDSDIKKIVSNADMARIKSKENIYKSYVIFDENMRAEIKLIAKLEKDLYSAIENNELEVYYQPKYNINTSKIVGAEALLRWNHSGMGIISPVKFIPIAEKNRFINKIGKWVFEDVCRNLRESIDEGIEVVPIAVNISRVELYQPTLIHNFQLALLKYKIAPELIEIEITETTALNNIKFINSKLSEIKGLGIKVAMDDFGTGNSNLSNLKDISIDVLKLDRSLLIDIENNDKTEVMVKSIVSLSKNLRMSTVCEGVENISQVEIIRNAGCEIVQGFLFSKPIKEDAYKRILKTNKL
ncbi:bifunctional diguanylate cyclase/phosphodiesterase [Romboutsia sp.]|uniref:bifunctional diguanylate cyclase/phosphodiesterase n=1 Tax=Romboutsia sp. TaxID=1965302 RepID=UPI003F355307